MKRSFALSCVLLLLTHEGFAWGPKGHEVVAYIAYQHLDPVTRSKVDDLVKPNPCYKEWSSAVSQLSTSQRPVALFMLAATWPDKIKSSPHGPPYRCQPGHTFIPDEGIGADGKLSADIPPNVPEAKQNIGYDDDRRHQYWHFIDLPISTDGTPTRDPYEVNAVSEITLLTTAIASDEPDALKSYDLVWLEHLVGDVHQPLHDATRFTSNHPNGDEGGNLVPICGTPNCKSELHGYWDQLPGPATKLTDAISMGVKLDKVPVPDDVDKSDPSQWASSGNNLAKTVSYSPPVTSDDAGSHAAPLGKDYRSRAKATMNSQLTLAGYRLANLLNTNLK